MITDEELKRVVDIQQGLFTALEDEAFERDFKTSATDNIDFLIGVICKYQQAQAPRVLAPEELEGRTGTPVWVEIRYGGGFNRWEIWQNYMTPVLAGYYGKTWRCWTNRPTTEQKASRGWI